MTLLASLGINLPKKQPTLRTSVPLLRQCMCRIVYSLLFLENLSLVVNRLAVATALN